MHWKMGTRKNGVQFARLAVLLLFIVNLSALKSFQVVVSSLNALTVPGVPSSYVKQLFEQPGPISVARRGHALHKSSCLSYCYWVEMWCPTLPPSGSTPVTRVATQLRPTKMAFFARYV